MLHCVTDYQGNRVQDPARAVFFFVFFSFFFLSSFMGQLQNHG